MNGMRTMFKQNVYDYIFSEIEILQHASVLDVGCLNAEALSFMKEKYNLTGELIGIDKRGKCFESSEQQSYLGVKLIEMNASEGLKFPDESFDFIFHKDTLECINDIDSHIKELHRILKKGGVIVCVHRDWESIVCNGSNKKLINKVIYEYANFLQSGWMDSCDGWIGRRLYGYFNKTGLFKSEVDLYNDIETEYVPGMRGYNYMQDMHDFIQPKGFLTQAEYDELLADLQNTYKKDEYLFSAPFYIYIGTKSN